MMIRDVNYSIYGLFNPMFVCVHWQTYCQPNLALLFGLDLGQRKNPSSKIWTKGEH